MPKCELDRLNFICDKYLLPYLNYVRENQEVLKIAHLHGKTIGLYDAFIGLYDNILIPILERFHYPKGDCRYIILYYVNGIHAIKLEWLQEGCNRPAEDISKIIQTCVLGLNGDTHICVNA
jgi:hypothetical protein